MFLKISWVMVFFFPSWIIWLFYNVLFLFLNGIFLRSATYTSWWKIRESFSQRLKSGTGAFKFFKLLPTCISVDISIVTLSQVMYLPLLFLHLVSVHSHPWSEFLINQSEGWSLLWLCQNSIKLSNHSSKSVLLEPFQRKMLFYFYRGSI